MNNPKDQDTIDALVADLKASISGASYTIASEEKEKTASVDTILTKVFVVVIAITMFLCFFSLSASMSANLYEQKKEVGVLRAMGFTKYRIKALYFYEALVLVFSSCVLGVGIGCIVGETMLLQQNLFLGLHLAFVFPWQEFVLIFGLSMFCAWISTYAPATSLTNRQIASIFRLV
jgi:ABC-type antimicrobial peptide transport system permease subunit